MKTGKQLVSAVLCTALALTGAAAAQPGPRQAQSYLDVLQNLTEQNGAYEKTQLGTLTGLALAKLIDFDGDGTQELLCAFGDKQSNMVNRQEVWTYSNGSASRIYVDNVANFGTDVSPESFIYSGDKRAYLVTGQEIMNGGEVAFLTKSADSMQTVLRYTDEMNPFDNGASGRHSYTLNGKEATKEQVDAAVEALTAGMKKNSYIYINSIPADNPIATLSSTFAALHASAMPTAARSTAAVYVDGQKKPLAAYTIGGNNYVKLRDLAAVLNKTAKQFSVTWNGATSEISMQSGQPYVSVGGELRAVAGGNKKAQFTSATVRLNSKLLLLDAFTIDGNNYFKLRDLARVLNFGVAWSGENGRLQIDTAVSYTE